MKILVTGGLGYIGSHTVVELQNEGFEVIIVDDLSFSDKKVLSKIEEITHILPKFHLIDLKNEQAVLDLFSTNKIDGVIHFAAHKAVGESVQLPLKYYRNNLVSLLNLIDNCILHKIEAFIFSSSCTVYGQADILPITEDVPFKKAESPYGKTKQMGEEILVDYANRYKQNVISLRYFNPIGAHPSTKIGELPIGVPNNLIPYLTQTVAGIRKELSVYGGDYPTRDGSAVRDYIHVCDLAKAHVLALKRLLDKKNKLNYEVFNLGTGTGSTVLEVIAAFEKATGLKVNYKITDRRPGDITAAFADNALAKEELGWEIKNSLEDTLLSAWKWQEKL